MTAPRQVLENATYLVTRRCAQRQFLLRPSKTANDVFLYLLAVAAQRFEIQVHVFCVLSNQYDRTDVRRPSGPAGRLSRPSGTLARALLAT